MSGYTLYETATVALHFFVGVLLASTPLAVGAGDSVALLANVPGFFGGPSWHVTIEIQVEFLTQVGTVSLQTRFGR